MDRTYAHRLIRGSQVADNLVLPRGNLYAPCEIQPIHEKQVRALLESLSPRSNVKYGRKL
jgi:hypothetical protein